MTKLNEREMLKLARNIVRKGPQDEYLDLIRAKKYGKFWAFTSDECNQLDAFKEQIINYLNLSEHKKPLCLAVFGPPGSGKSFAVKEIKGLIKEYGEEEDAEWKDRINYTKINLTQIPDSRALGEALAETAKADKYEVPFVFFDEFDTAKNGTPLGWLSWFLSPMNDGEWRLDGVAKELKRAIYVFAGGTAHCFSDFGSKDSEQFINAKGPDFISRLDGYLDVKGPNNSSYTLCRRAIILHNALAARATLRGFKEAQGLKISNKLLDALLNVGQYRHGSRSIEAVISMSETIEESEKILYPLEHEDLPSQHLLDIHSSRGILDPQFIGGTIQISGGAAEDKQKPLESPWVLIATKLWNEGATLAYGGKPLTKKGTLTTLLKKEVEKLPKSLNKIYDCKLELNVAPHLLRVLSFPSHLDKEFGDSKRISPEIQQEHVYGLNGYEYKYLLEKNVDLLDDEIINRIISSISLFRMRFQIAEASKATVAIGGTIGIWSGRFPGLAEEIMLALAFGHPIYICGYPRGWVRELGELLGLERPWTGRSKKLRLSKKNKPEEFFEALKPYNYVFRPPGHESLPITTDELIDFFAKHTVDSEKWPDNGLTIEENRALFLERNKNKAVELIIRGLRNRFG